MTNSNFNHLDIPFKLEALIEDAIGEIVKQEDAQQFIGWMRENIYDYYTGPDVRQAGLFDDVKPAIPGQIIIDPEMARALAFNFAIMIWNGMPLPSNHFKPQPVPIPKRNDPCHCGSGKKYKQCCARLPSIPTLSPNELWPTLFDKLDKNTAAQAIRNNHIPLDALNMTALNHLEFDRPKKAIAMLAPLFESKISKTNDDAEYALTLLCNAYDELAHTNKKSTLLQTIVDCVPRSPLRSGAWQRIATIQIDNGDADSAWQAFKNAQRDDPHSYGLGVLEVQILNAQGHNEKAAERAKFWVHTLRKTGLDDEEMPLAFLINVANNPTEAFTELGLNMASDAGILLKQWLEKVQHRPLPVYAIYDEASEGDSNDESIDLKAMRKQMQSLNMDEDDIEIMLQEINDNALNAEAEDEEPMPDFSTMLLQTPKKIIKLEHDWHDIYPLEKPFSTHEVPFGFEEDDPWDTFEEQAWGGWLQTHPAAFDSIDILDDLVTALLIHPQFGGAWLYEKMLQPILLRVEAILEDSLTKAGQPELSWMISKNRPALRSMARLINIAEMHDKQDEVLRRSQRLIAINPHDNHGYRMLVINQLLHESRNKEALALAQQFPNDMNPEIAFGAVLALYRLDRQKEAVQSLGNALEGLEKIPRYLIAKRIKKPKLNPQGVMYGGDDQAWYYREAMRDIWLETPGAIEWLKKAENAFR